MRIDFFGKLRDCIAGAVEIDLPPDVTTVGELRQLLANAYPEAAEELLRPSNRACVDDRIVDEAWQIQDCRSVEFLPPLSGG